MGDGVDASCQAGHDDEACFGQIACEALRHLQAGGRGIPRTDDGNARCAERSRIPSDSNERRRAVDGREIAGDSPLRRSRRSAHPCDVRRPFRARHPRAKPTLIDPRPRLRARSGRASSAAPAPPKWLTRQRKVRGPTPSLRMSRNHWSRCSSVSRSVPDDAGGMDLLTPSPQSCLPCPLAAVRYSHGASRTVRRPASRKRALHPLARARAGPWARSTCDKRRERRVAKQRGTAEPDSGESEARGPRYTEQRAEEGRDTLSAFEAEPCRDDVAQECADRPQPARPAGPIERGPAPRLFPSTHHRAALRLRAPFARSASTFVAPILPEPIVRMSCVPAIRVIRIQTGSTRGDSRTGGRGSGAWQIRS